MSEKFDIFKFNFKLFLKKIYMFLYQKRHRIEDNKIVFLSFGGKQYSDSGRMIGEELYHQNKKLKIVWLLNNDALKDKYHIIPKYIVKKENTLLNSLQEIATSKVFITNGNFEMIYKSKQQMFIDTWHGDRGFKKILKDINDSSRYIQVYDNKVVDYCIAGSDFGVKIFRNAFLYNGKIIKEGMPRNDALVNGSKNVSNIRKMFNLKEEKILLYAPTYRDKTSNMPNITVDFDKILSELSIKDGKIWKLAIRSHPASMGLNVKIDKRNLLDVSDYPDMSDILQITDFLITDYSSTAGDFILTKKPIILFLYDYDEYRKVCRELYVDPKEVGFIYAKKEEELIKLIKEKEITDYLKASDKVSNYYQIHETGKSTKIVCDYIMDFINHNKKNN